MPSALLTVVPAGAHGCNARLASKLVFATSVANAATVVTMTRLLG